MFKMGSKIAKGQEAASTVKWIVIKSGILQGSGLEPILFTIFINDIDEEIIYQVSKFADTKIASQVNTLND